MKITIPPCPKCKNTNTTDLIPKKPTKSGLEIPPDYFELEGTTLGNCKFYCNDCHYTWKKHRGKKPYSTIMKLEIYSGGYPGPNFQVLVDFHNHTIERSEVFYEGKLISPVELQDSDIIREKLTLFLNKLYECDLMNWASEYQNFSILDGTSWRVQITYDTYCEEKSGCNHFPPKWNKFCNAVAKLSGGKFY